MSLSAFSPAMTAVALLSTLSWAGFIVSGFMLWNYGNTDGGYSMVGIAICLPAVIAAILLIARSFHTEAAKRSALMAGTALLSTLSWIGFIVAGFMLWAVGNTNGGYSMVGIAIILPAVVAALVPVVAHFQRSAADAAASAVATAFSPQMTAVSLLSVLSWAGFIVAGFMLWATGNTSGGYAMVGIAICLPAAVAALVALAQALPAKATAAASVVVPEVSAAPAAPAAASAASVVVDAAVVVKQTDVSGATA
jgi:hypothetical protein